MLTATHVVPFFGPTLEHGGMATAAGHICYSLSELGVSVTVVTTTIGGEEDGVESSDHNEAGEGIRVLRSRILSPTLGRVSGFYPSLGFRKVCKPAIEEADIVHFHGARSFQNLSAGRKALKARIKYVIQPHGSLPRNLGKGLPKSVYDGLFGNIHFANSDRMIATSLVERELMLRQGIPSRKIEVIHNGIDRQFWAESNPADAGLRETLGIPSHPAIVLFVGRLDLSKGLDILVRAFASLRRKTPESVLVIAGPDFGERRKLTRLRKTLRLEKDVVFTGPLSRFEIRAAYKMATVTVLPSTFESFGLVALEAAASGCAVIVTRTCGIAALLHSAGGIVVEPSVEELSTALARVIQNIDVRELEVRALSRLPWDELSWKAVGRRLLGVYESIVT